MRIPHMVLKKRFDMKKLIEKLEALSKRMMTTIKLNMTFSMTLNFIAIILAMTGTLSPVVGALFSISQDAPVSAFSVSSASLVSQS